MNRYLKLGRVFAIQLFPVVVIGGAIALIATGGGGGLAAAVLLGWILLCPFFGVRIAATKGRSKTGAFALCLLAGLIGLLILWFLPESTETRVRKEAEVRRQMRELDED